MTFKRTFLMISVVALGAIATSSILEEQVVPETAVAQTHSTEQLAKISTRDLIAELLERRADPTMTMLQETMKTTTLDQALSEKKAGDPFVENNCVAGIYGGTCGDGKVFLTCDCTRGGTVPDHTGRGAHGCKRCCHEGTGTTRVCDFVAIPPPPPPLQDISSTGTGTYGTGADESGGWA